jgi:hypothetical protein
MCTGTYVIVTVWYSCVKSVVIECTINKATQKYVKCLGFEILTAVVIKSTIFWDVTQWITWRYIPEDSTLHLKCSFRAV